MTTKFIEWMKDNLNQVTKIINNNELDLIYFFGMKKILIQFIHTDNETIIIMYLSDIENIENLKNMFAFGIMPYSNYYYINTNGDPYTSGNTYLDNYKTTNIYPEISYFIISISNSDSANINKLLLYINDNLVPKEIDDDDPLLQFVKPFCAHKMAQLKRRLEITKKIEQAELEKEERKQAEIERTIQIVALANEKAELERRAKSIEKKARANALIEAKAKARAEEEKRDKEEREALAREAEKPKKKTNTKKSSKVNEKKPKTEEKRIAQMRAEEQAMLEEQMREQRIAQMRAEEQAKLEEQMRAQRIAQMRAEEQAKLEAMAEAMAEAQDGKTKQNYITLKSKKTKELNPFEFRVNISNIPKHSKNLGRDVIEYHIDNACPANYTPLSLIQGLLITIVYNNNLTDFKKFRLLLNCIYLRYNDFIKFLPKPNVDQQAVYQADMIIIRSNRELYESEKKDIEDEKLAQKNDIEGEGEGEKPIPKRDKATLERRQRLERIKEYIVMKEIVENHQDAITKTSAVLFVFCDYMTQVNDDKYKNILVDGSLQEKQDDFKEKLEGITDMTGITTLLNPRKFNSDVNFVKKVIETLRSESFSLPIFTIKSAVFGDIMRKIETIKDGNSKSPDINILITNIYNRFNQERRRQQLERERIERERERERRERIERERERRERLKNENKKGQSPRRSRCCKDCKYHLSKKPVVELKFIAKHLGCKCSSKLLKSELIRFIMKNC
jgi:hypothetical protein